MERIYEIYKFYRFAYKIISKNSDDNIEDLNNYQKIVDDDYSYILFSKNIEHFSEL